MTWNTDKNPGCRCGLPHEAWLPELSAEVHAHACASSGGRPISHLSGSQLREACIPEEVQNLWPWSEGLHGSVIKTDGLAQKETGAGQMMEGHQRATRGDAISLSLRDDLLEKSVPCRHYH